MHGLRIAWDHDSDGDYPRVLIHWRADRGPFEVQARRRGRDWRVLRKGTSERRVVIRLAHGRWTFRVRSRPGFARPGPWAHAHARIQR